MCGAWMRAGVLELIEDDSLAGECMWITNRLGRQWWPTPGEKARYLVHPGDAARPASEAHTSPGSHAPKSGNVSLGQAYALPPSYSKM